MKHPPSRSSSLERCKSAAAVAAAAAAADTAAPGHAFPPLSAATIATSDTAAALPHPLIGPLTTTTNPPTQVHR